MSKMSKAEAKEILEEVKLLDDTIFQFCKKYMEALEVAIENLETDWTPTRNNNYPDTDEMMLVTCKTQKGVYNVNRAYYSNGSWHGSGSMSGVIAYMPMPAHYEEEEE